MLLMIPGLLFFSCQSYPNEQPTTGKLFIIGGGPRPELLVQRMIQEAGLHEQGYVIILPMASEELDSAICWSSEQFVKQGITQVSGFNFLYGQTPDPAQIDSLRHASLIYISGGDQNTFMRIVADTEIEAAIHEAFANGAMIAGTSAGAAVMSKVMITGNELLQPDYRATFRTIEARNIETGKGLGLITSAIIDQHFLWRSRHNRLLTAVIEYPQLKGIGIDESTAILVSGNSAEVVGISQVIVFENPDNSYRELQGKLGAYKLQISLYLPGDKFSIE